MKNICSYCRASNAEDDHRCQRCGRRLGVGAPRAMGNGAFVVSQAATARALRPIPPPEAIETAEPAISPPDTSAEPQPRRPAYQRSLFSFREVPEIVPFETIAPRTDRPRPRAASPKQRTRRQVPGQQTLGFMAPAPTVDAGSEALIYCDAPVAVVVHRMMAGAVDLSIIAIALGLFLGIFHAVCALFHVTGGQVTLNAQTIPLFLGIALVFGLLYKIMWCLAGGDSPGMRWTRLRLVNFDGLRPDREQRLCRLASGCLSFTAAGLGVVWALVDEEMLTWHDHISKTFPTPADRA